MEQTSSRDEMTVQHQFDRMCKLVLRNALIDHKRQAKYLHRINAIKVPKLK